MTKKPNIRRRIVRPKPETREQKQERVLSAYERQTLVATNFIMNHNQYPTIIAMMRLGTSNADIADFFLERGDFSVNRKTAVNYLSMFRRAHAALCEPMDPSKTDGIVSYDHLFDGNSALLTADVEMAKLIALQKARVSIDFTSERNIGKLFNTTHKEVQILGNLIEQYGKLKGGSSGGVTQGMGMPADEDVKDGVQNIQHDEQRRAALTSAIYNLVKAGQ